MGSTSNPTLSNSTYSGAFDAGWASVFSLMDFPQYYPELSQKYGGAFGVFEYLKFAGQEGTCAGPTETLFEAGAPERYLTLNAQAATAVAAAPLTLEVTDWGNGTTGVSGKSTLTVGDKVLIPAAYCTVGGVKPTVGQWYQVTAVQATQNPARDTNFTCYALGSTVAVAVAIPIATKLMVTGGNYAPGSLGAKAKTLGWYSRTFKTAIKRTAMKIEGSQQSNERYLEKLKGGGMGIFSEAMIGAEFRHNHALNYEILLGTEPDQITMLDDDGAATGTVRGTKGILPHLSEGGCKIFYTAGNGFTVPDIENIKKAFISQGVTDSSAGLFGSYELLRGIENNALDFVKEYSGGSDFLDGLKNLQVGFKVIKKAGLTLTMHELLNLSNPNTLGQYTELTKGGFIVPTTQVTVRDSAMGADVKMANLSIAYKNYNGENRERIFQPIAGVNGLSMVGGNNIADAYDRVKWEILTEFMLRAVKRNQMILVQPDSVL